MDVSNFPFINLIDRVYIGLYSEMHLHVDLIIFPFSQHFVRKMMFYLRKTISDNKCTVLYQNPVIDFIIFSIILM